MTQVANYWDQTHPPRSRSSQEVAEQGLLPSLCCSRWIPSETEEGSGCVMRSGSLPTLQGREMLAFWEPKQRVGTFYGIIYRQWGCPVSSPALVTSFSPLDISLDGRLLTACVLVGAATGELERELVSGEGWQRCRLQSLRAAMWWLCSLAGLSEGSHNSFLLCVSGEGCPCAQEASARDVEDGGGVVAVTVPRRSRQGGPVTAHTGVCRSNRSVTGVGSKWAEAPDLWDLFLQLFQAFSCRSWWQWRRGGLMWTSVRGRRRSAAPLRSSYLRHHPRWDFGLDTRSRRDSWTDCSAFSVDLTPFFNILPSDSASQS